VWYAQAHDLADRAVGFVSNNHGGKGGGVDKRGKDNAEALKSLLACTRVRCMVLRPCALLTTNTLTPSVQLTPSKLTQAVP
jgi:hypothetical protein